MRYYTDGSTYPSNPGYGGVAVFIEGKTKNFIRSIHLNETTTNNQAETRALLEAIYLAIIFNDYNVTLLTDSEYVSFGIRRITMNKPLLSTNVEVWQKVKDAYRNLNSNAKAINRPLFFTATHVPGHIGVIGNEIADCLAYLASRQTEYEQYLSKEETDEFGKTIKKEKARRKRTA